MRYSKTVHIIFSILFIFTQVNSLQAMEANEEESIKKYYQSQGRQIQDLQNTDSPYVKGSNGGRIAYLRWVDDLGLVYGNKKIPRYEDMPQIPATIHQELSKIGVRLKLLNGYYRGDDDLTPDQSNFLVPYISFIVKWGGDKAQTEFIPGGYLSFKNNKRAVFLSGSGKVGDILAGAYNGLMGDPAIEIINGNNIHKFKHEKKLSLLQDPEFINFLSTKVKNLEEQIKKLNSGKSGKDGKKIQELNERQERYNTLLACAKPEVTYEKLNENSVFNTEDDLYRFLSAIDDLSKKDRDSKVSTQFKEIQFNTNPSTQDHSENWFFEGLWAYPDPLLSLLRSVRQKRMGQQAELLVLQL